MELHEVSRRPQRRGPAAIQPATRSRGHRERSETTCLTWNASSATSISISSISSCVGAFAPGVRVLDAACGGGRNLVYLLQSGYDVFAVDADAAAIDAVRQMAATLAPQLPPGNFRVEAVEQMTFADAFADVVLSSAVLHFARDDNQFDAMVAEMWRVLKPGGMLFCRLASSIGMEERMRRVNGRTVPAAGRQRAVSRRRADADGPHGSPRRQAARSSEDDCGAGSAVHDDVGRQQKALKSRDSCKTNRCSVPS